VGTAPESVSLSPSSPEPSSAPGSSDEQLELF